MNIEAHILTILSLKTLDLVHFHVPHTTMIYITHIERDLSNELVKMVECEALVYYVTLNE